MVSTFITSLIIFLGTYSALVLRNILKLRVPIWLILLLGATAMIGSGSIAPQIAYASINMDVLTFLFGMFVIVSSLDISGVLEFFTSRMLRVSKGPRTVVAMVFIVFGFLSAFLMNDTLALMGTPIVISIARRTGMNPKILLISLAFAVTVGSAVTPMGNPQNLLVALASKINAPVISFLKYLLIPTIVNLLLSTAFIIFFVRDRNFNFYSTSLASPQIRDRRLAFVSVFFSLFTLSLIFVINIVESLGGSSYLGISEVSLIGATLTLAFSKRPREILESVDWGILVMFASLFIMMEALSSNGVIRQISAFLPSPSSLAGGGALIPIVLSSLFLSQVVSNVPTVALYIPIMLSSGFGPQNVVAWLALAGASTLAGNLTILGAASNLIIIERAEKEGLTISFFEFFRVGIFITAINISVLLLFLFLGL